MDSGNVPPQRSDWVVVRGDRNCFYRAFALWRDEMSDEKHEEIRRLSSALIEKNPKFFSRNSSLRTLWRNMTTVEGRTCRHIFKIVHRCDRFAPSRRRRKSVLLLNQLSLINVHRSQQRIKATFFEISTGEQHTATDLVNLLYFLRAVSPDHTDFVSEFEQDG